MRLSMAPRSIACGKLISTVLLAFIFCAAHPAATAYAKKKKPANYGTIKVQTSPAGFPIELDGKPEGETTADWRSWDRDPGVHTVVVILPNGQRWTREISLEAGRIKCVTLNYRPGQPPPPPPSPCPFPVNLSAPVSVNDGEIITYTADVSYSGTSALSYTWTVSPANAKVLSGLGTPTITVDSTGLGGQRISAMLLVNDGSGESACRQTAQAFTNVVAPPPPRVGREFDVCCSCSYDDQKARLDNLAVDMQNDPSTTAYIISYGGRTSRVGQADYLGTRARDYIVSQRGISASRITVLNGGFREEDCTELWIVPSGATPPQPRPTVQASDLRPAPESPARRRPRN